MFPLPCVVFAGGKSSRMGEDKALLPFGGRPSLAQYQYERLLPLFESVHLSTDRAKFDFDAPLIPDPVTGIHAPTVGFIALFDTLDTDRAFVLSVDTPFVGEDVIMALLDADTPELDAVVARTGNGLHPMCGIYHRSMLPAFRNMLETDDHRLGKLLKERRVVEVMFTDEAPFANLNHPHEYEAAIARLRGN